MQRRFISVLICPVILLAICAIDPAALAQSGMTGGSIGKQQKSATSSDEQPAAAAAPAAIERPVTADEFRRELVGLALCGTAPSGPYKDKTICSVYSADGTVTLSGPQLNARGVWEIVDNKVCRRSADAPREKAVCLSYVRLSAQRFRNTSGMEFCIGPCQ